MLSCRFQYQTQHFNLDVNLEMQGQLLIGIVGASGSGKSTLLKNIAGLLTPTQGFICFDQNILVDTTQSIFVPCYKRKIALIFQQALLFPHLNVMQNLRYGEHNRSPSERKFQLDDIVDLLDIGSLIYRKAHQLSGGEAQRVSIARALLSSPNMLLLDEPLSGLDTQIKQQILPFFQRIQHEINMPMLYVTHHIEELHFLDAPILELKNGCLNTQELLTP